jgi:hypothetical protein
MTAAAGARRVTPAGGIFYDQLGKAARRKALTILRARWEEDELDSLSYCLNGHPTRLEAAQRCRSCLEARA